MYTGSTIFSQLMDFLPWRRFQTCVDRYSGNYKVKAFTCVDHFRVMAFAQLYKARWQIELFFKWIKQHLRIKSFYGTSQNAVKTQLWIAISTYLLVVILKKELQLELPLYTILQVLSLSLFEKDHILQVLTDSNYKNESILSSNQLSLFD